MSKYKYNISSKIRNLRKERRWTQAKFAELLGISQSRLSEIERGDGSFTAEQFLLILQKFKVPLDHFIQTSVNTETKLQDALARLGAAHLSEEQDVLPSEKLAQVTDVVREVLVSAESSRLITALAPVLVLHVRQLDLLGLESKLRDIGLPNRLGWLTENIVYALEKELEGMLPKSWFLKYRQAKIVLENEVWLRFVKNNLGEDIIDAEITSEATREIVKEARSDISKKWHIVTRIQPEDFINALRSARENDQRIL